MVKKSSLFFFLILSGCIVFLYTIFPLDDTIQVTENTSGVEAVIEEEDPMLGQQTEEILTPTEIEEETLDEDDLSEEEEAKRLAEEQQRASEEAKKKEEEQRKKEEKERKKREEAEKNKSANEKKIDKIIKQARSKLGKPYKQAGTTDKGYDCSGLIMTSYKKYGYQLPRASYQMASKGTAVNLKNVKKGDLLFFGTKSETPKRVSHVGMVTKVKDGKIYFIHSSEKSGVILNTMNEGYYKKRYLKAKRYLK